MNLSKLKKRLIGINDNHLVKIRYLKKPQGHYILYFDYYHKSSRAKFYPGLKLSLSQDSDVTDEKVLLYAAALRDQKEDQIAAGIKFTDPLDNATQDTNMYDLAVSILSDKKPKNAALYQTAYNSFLALYPGIRITEITEKHVKAFRARISNLSPTTQKHYIRSLAHLCDHAIHAGYIESNPFANIKIKSPKPIKNFLTLDEIKLVMNAECTHEAVQRAFIFSIFTGLRYGDIAKLDYSMLQDGYLIFQQNKTGSHEKIKLPDPALDQIVPGEGKLFALPAYKQSRKALANLIENAGITKRITFHCARHTFATMCLTLGIDVYTVSKLLGHSDVRVTQIYAKLIDQVKDNAIIKLNDEWKA